MSDEDKMKKEHKYLLIGIVSTLILVFAIVMIVKINNYSSRPIPHVFEIKLYDDNWVELEKRDNTTYFPSYEVAYDGTKKGFNMICYVDGHEFYRYHYKDSPKNKSPSPIRISFEYASGITQFPTNKGRYGIYYQFDSLGSSPGRTFTTPIGNVSVNEFPRNDIDLIYIEII